MFLYLLETLEYLLLNPKTIRRVTKIEDFALRPLPSSSILPRLRRLAGGHHCPAEDPSKRGDKRTFYVVERVDGSVGLTRSLESLPAASAPGKQYIAVLNDKVDASRAISAFQRSLTAANAFSVAEVVTAAVLVRFLSAERLACAFARDLRIALEVIDAESMDMLSFENQEVVCLNEE